MKPTRFVTAAGLTASVLTLLPAYASGAPTSGPTAPAGPKRVVSGPDIAAGAQNAPGSQAISDLINTVGFYAIVACLLGLLISGLIVALGPRLGFAQASTIGKVGIIAALGVAFLVGISATLINFFYNAGA